MNMKLVAAGVALLAAGAFAAGWYVRGQGARADLASVKLDMAAQQTGYALASAQAESVALASYQALAERLAEIDKTHRQEMNDAKVKADRVIADLRSGALRLRDEWATARATAATVQAAAAVGGADGGSALREQGAADLVRAGAECDSTIRALQHALIATQTCPQVDP